MDSLSDIKYNWGSLTGVFIVKKDAITVGNTTMFATQIPVNVLFDEIYAAEGEEEGIIGERFKILEIDGAHLVMRESISETEPAVQEFIAFCTEDDAFEYLRMFGIEEEQGEEEGDYEEL